MEPVSERPVRLREFVSVLVLVVLCDLVIYRGQGFAGYAALFFAAPLLLWIGSPNGRRGAGFWTVGLMLLLLAGRTLWLGSTLLQMCGFTLIAAFSMTLSGLCPHAIEVPLFASQTLYSGYAGLIRYARAVNRLSPSPERAKWMSVALPLAVFLAFGTLFVLANPDLLRTFSEQLARVLEQLRDWLIAFSPSLSEVLFWIAVSWISVGLLRPILVRNHAGRGKNAEQDAAPVPGGDAALYAAFRNTLVTVIVLFAVYLAFEFITLWFREFPEGFYYSGYAHEGAAWLTVALALATVILSLVFRGRVLHDRRIGRLRTLAWIWSFENLVLAIAVYNRLWIYIGFNGMSPLRVVGIYGMTTVVVGFLLVVWKIVHHRDFAWLVRRQLWALAVAIYLLAITPVDVIVVSYNVRRILEGDPAPAVQISVQQITPEGVVYLKPLLDYEPGDRNAIIREGVRAFLAERLEEAESRPARGWTAFQGAERFMLRKLQSVRGRLDDYADEARREETLARFHEYVYQWF